MEDSPYQIDAGFQKTSTLCEFTRSGATRPFIFTTPRDLFTGYGWWCGLVLYWFLTLSQISELLQWPNHVVCFFHCFNSSQRKNPQQPKKKRLLTVWSCFMYKKSSPPTSVSWNTKGIFPLPGNCPGQHRIPFRSRLWRFLCLNLLSDNAGWKPPVFFGGKKWGQNRLDLK